MTAHCADTSNTELSNIQPLTQSRGTPCELENGDLAVQAFLDGQDALEASTADTIQDVIAKIGFKVSPSLDA